MTETKLEPNKNTTSLDHYFKIPGSKREKVTETTTYTNVWLYENGEKVELLSNRKADDQVVEVLSLGTIYNLETQIEREAIDYVERKIIKSYHDVQPEALGASKIWAKNLANSLLPQSLTFLRVVLIHLKKLSIPLTINGDNLADWLLKDLEANLVEKYNKSELDQQDKFKKEIASKFPNSTILLLLGYDWKLKDNK